MAIRATLPGCERGKAYFTCLKLKRQISLAETVKHLRDEGAKSTKDNYASGTAGSQSWLSAKNSSNQAKTGVSGLRQALNAAQEALDLLLGRVAFQQEIVFKAPFAS